MQKYLKYIVKRKKHLSIQQAVIEIPLNTRHHSRNWGYNKKQTWQKYLSSSISYSSDIRQPTRLSEKMTYGQKKKKTFNVYFKIHITHIQKALRNQ